jgi:hypothetical protein
MTTSTATYKRLYPSHPANVGRGKSNAYVHAMAPPQRAPETHVHVESTAGGEVLVLLGDEETPPTLWQNHHMKAVHAREALRIVEANQLHFLAEWRRLHG